MAQPPSINRTCQHSPPPAPDSSPKEEVLPLKGADVSASGLNRQSLGHCSAGRVECLNWKIPEVPSDPHVSEALVARVSDGSGPRGALRGAGRPHVQGPLDGCYSDRWVLGLRLSSGWYLHPAGSSAVLGTAQDGTGIRMAARPRPPGA